MVDLLYPVLRKVALIRITVEVKQSPAGRLQADGGCGTLDDLAGGQSPCPQLPDARVPVRLAQLVPGRMEDQGVMQKLGRRSAPQHARQ